MLASRNAVVSVRSGYGLLMLLSICCSDCHCVSLTRFHSMRGVNMTAGSAKTQAPKARKRVDVDPSLLKRSTDGSAFTRWYEHNLVAKWFLPLLYSAMYDIYYTLIVIDLVLYLASCYRCLSVAFFWTARTATRISLLPLLTCTIAKRTQKPKQWLVSFSCPCYWR